VLILSVIVVATVVRFPRGSSSNHMPPCLVYSSNSGSPPYLGQTFGSCVDLRVRLFYYNTASTKSINTLEEITVYAPVLGESSSIRNVTSLFPISASVAQIQIGGPQNESEGIEVTYTIHSTGSVQSGTYEIALDGVIYTSTNIDACGDGIYSGLQVGHTTNALVGTTCHVMPPPQDEPYAVYYEPVGNWSGF
jgi:hypothetical protein